LGTLPEHVVLHRRCDQAFAIKFLLFNIFYVFLGNAFFHLVKLRSLGKRYTDESCYPPFEAFEHIHQDTDFGRLLNPFGIQLQAYQVFINILF